MYITIKTSKHMYSLIHMLNILIYLSLIYDNFANREPKEQRSDVDAEIIVHNYETYICVLTIVEIHSLLLL
jgi:hypothetical protein